MPVISYDYLPSPQIINKKLIAIYSPIIRIRLSAKHKVYPYSLDCLVDSGADYNLFPASIGETLGLTIKKGKQTQHIGIANIGIIAYRHQVKLFLPGYNFTTEIDFSYDHVIPLVGRDGFFKYFKKVIFNQEELKVELHY